MILVWDMYNLFSFCYYDPVLKCRQGAYPLNKVNPLLFGGKIKCIEYALYAYLGSEFDQGLDEHRSLHSHVQAAGDAGTLQDL